MIDKNIKIEDNVLDQKEFVKLQTFMMGNDVPWFYLGGIEYVNEADKFQFILGFYRDNAPLPLCETINPILEIIQPISLLRVKANLLTKTSTIVENSFHIDLNDLTEEKTKLFTTSIFYVNTNNGYTKFENGSIVESIANRMVTFPTNLKHAGTSCTDEKTRVVINFNYVK
jgi:hypothetical protein